jgi:excisionase family DNA binding protein
MMLNNRISVKVAAIHSGYSLQYLHRLLRDGRLTGVKLGQTWLIDKHTFEAYLKYAIHIQDRRFGPK